MAVSLIFVEQPGLRIADVQFVSLYFGKDVPVRDEDVLPPVVVEVEEPRAPADILAVWPKAGLEDGVEERAVPVVVVEVDGFVGKIGLYDIQPAVAVVITDSDSHSALGRPIAAQRAPRGHAHLGKGAVTVVVVKLTRGLIAGHVDIRPAVIVEICRHGGHSVGAYGSPVVVH